MPRDIATRTAQVRVATWNIHGGGGRDGRYDPARIVAAIERDAPGPIVLMGDVNEWYLSRYQHLDRWRKAAAWSADAHHRVRCAKWSVRTPAPCRSCRH